MNLQLTINGITRTYQGSYDEMYNRDWNTRVQDLLDSALEYEPEVPRQALSTPRHCTTNDKAVQ